MSSKSKPTKEDATVKIAKINQTGILIGLLITAIFAPIVMMIANKTINATAATTPTSFLSETSTPFPSETSVTDWTFDPTQEMTETPVSLPSDIPSATLPPNVGTMKAQVFYNYGTGNAPLQASFDASTSFVSYPDGSSIDCTFSNVCTFSWDVRIGSNSIYGPVADDAKFAYTFQKKGDYTVVVYVCRGEICNFAAASVVVK